MILVVNEIRGQHSPLQYRNFQAPKNRLDGIGQIRRCEERGEDLRQCVDQHADRFVWRQIEIAGVEGARYELLQDVLSRAAAPQGAKPALFDGVEAGQKIAERRCVRRGRRR